MAESGHRLAGLWGAEEPPVTARDVAEAANVSVSTVSRVLSGRRPVKPELAEVVREASERLGYRPNYLARALRRQATQTVGMLVPQIADPFFVGMVEAAERLLHAEEHELFLCDSQDSPELEAVRARALIDRRVDGLLLIPCDTTSAETVRGCAQRVPIVQLDRYVEGVSADFVGTDNREGVSAALDHLRALGRRRIAFVGAKSSASTAVERLEAYRKGVSRAFHPSSARNILLGDFSIEWGESAARQMALHGLPDAILCGNDLIALGILREFRAQRIAVPADVAVVGYNDIFADLANPPLTSVRQPRQGLGEEAARLLLRRLRGEAAGPPQHIRLVPSLVVRESTVPEAVERETP
jgi:LacI family transcriptional regulator